MLPCPLPPAPWPCPAGSGEEALGPCTAREVVFKPLLDAEQAALEWENLERPAMPRAYGVVRLGGVDYLVMERMHSDLQAFLGSRARPGSRGSGVDVLCALGSATTAVQRLSDAGIVNRDIKRECWRGGCSQEVGGPARATLSAVALPPCCCSAPATLPRPPLPQPPTCWWTFAAEAASWRARAWGWSWATWASLCCCRPTPARPAACPARAQSASHLQLLRALCLLHCLENQAGGCRISRRRARGSMAPPPAPAHAMQPHRQRVRPAPGGIP